MKFSIVIPVYNVEKYLEQCLNSVLNQSYNDPYEVICVNDGSTDSSLAILRDYEKHYQYLKIIDTKNGGTASARNIGLENAAGEYVWFVDSDDWIAENSLQIIENQLKNEDLDVLGFNGKLIYENDGRIEFDEMQPETFTSGWEYYNKYALQGRKFHFVCVVLRVYRREFLIENQLFFDKGVSFEDNLWIPQVFYSAKKTMVISDYLYFYLIREGSKMTQINPRRFFDIIHVANTLSDFFLNSKGKNLEVVFHDLAYYYPNILINVKKANRQDLVNDIYARINWNNYKRISQGLDKPMYYMVKHKIPLFYHYQLIKKIKRKIFHK
jgi:glycosyltransferase involved in cell wall biosynthesis